MPRVSPAKLVDAFVASFGQKPTWIVRAPGRVNLIGEHTDYNGGFVLPVAIDRAAWIVLRPRSDGRVWAESLDFHAATGFSLKIARELTPSTRSHPLAWARYLEGVAWSLQQEAFALTGWTGVIRGDVPIGAGLSSSAAIEVATARAFATTSVLPWQPVRIAQICQRAENAWVGVNCGIMDQWIAAAARAGHALLIDCGRLQSHEVPIPRGVAVVILDTGTRRDLRDSSYNQRRQECEEAACLLGVKMLSELSWEEFQSRQAILPEPYRRRARHVISENKRTLEATQAMRAGNVERFGRLLSESHQSLRDDFEVSSPALNLMVELAESESGCFGARMTGAGFGGCALALVAADRAAEFAERVAAQYQKQARCEAKVYVCRVTDGAQVWPAAEAENVACLGDESHTCI